MLRRPTNDLSIRPKVSRSIVMAIVASAAFVYLASLYVVYTRGVQAGHTQYAEDQALKSQLSVAAGKLREELAATQEDLIFAQRQQQIQEEAYKQISKAYANSERKNSVLGSRLDFYRSIISPEDGQSGPAIQALEHEFVSGQLTFDITLVQAIKHKHQVRGSLRVWLYEDDKIVAQWPATSARSVSYQYFQQISGSIERDSLVDAAKLKVELSLQGDEKLERWFDLSIN